MTRLRLAAPLVPLALSSLAHGQVVEGEVFDAETGETLAGANVALLGPDGAVVGGTSTNADGRFSLRVDAFPADLAVRYIGYETDRRRVEAGGGPLRVALRPDTGTLGEVTVTPGEDPAVALMRRVIARTRAQRDALGPYAVTAYARTTIRDPEREIKGIAEAVSDAYWAPGDGWREVVVAQQRTGNMGSGGSTAIADGLVDLLAPDVEVAGHRLVGPTHPDALGVYRFEIVGTQALDGRLVVEVALEPRRAMASAFVGTLTVLFSSADVLAADLEPGPAFLFPPPIRISETRFRQQYVPVAADSSLWLPADLRSTYGFGIGVDGLLEADPFFIDRAAQFSDYRLGAVAPDSLLDGAAVRRAAAPDSSRLTAPGAAVPLTAAERRAYAAGDSLGSIEDVLVLRGPLAPLARGNIRVSSGGGGGDSAEPTPLLGFSLAPRFAVNPAEYLRAGLGVDLRVGRAHVIPYAAFRVADAGVSYGVDARALLAQLGSDRRPVLAGVVGSLSDGVERRVAPGAAGVLPLGLGGPGGYYASRRAAGGVRVRAPVVGVVRDGGFSQFDVAAEASLQFVAETASTYDPGPEGVALRSDLLPLGAAGARQTVRSLRLDAALGTLEVPLGLLPRRAVSVSAEWAPSALDAPAFWRADAVVETRFKTFARRRALAPALDVRLAGGVSSGDLPAIRQFALEHAVGEGAFGVTGFGALRSRTDVPLPGDRYALFAWEHSFRTLPFEALGLNGLTRRAYNVIVHGASAGVWGEGGGRGHHEVGLSLSGLLGGLRLDLTQRIDRPGTALGLSVARAF